MNGARIKDSITPNYDMFTFELFVLDVNHMPELTHSIILAPLNETECDPCQNQHDNHARGKNQQFLENDITPLLPSGVFAPASRISAAKSSSGAPPSTRGRCR